MTLPVRFARHLTELPWPGGVRRTVLAVSGGADSLAMLDLFAGAPTPAGHPLAVAHVDHGLHPESGEVARQVEQAAGRYGIPCRHARLYLPAGASETKARRARYRALWALAGPDAALVTAHHQDDQVETILMRLLQGSGPAGLAGMTAVRGRLVRPLLPFRAAELRAWALGRGFTPWADPANRDPIHLRSWMRTVLLPLVQERIPNVVQLVERTGELAAADRAAWNALLDRLPLDCRAECGGVSVAAEVLARYDSLLAEALIMALGRRAGRPIGRDRAAGVDRLVRSGGSGRRLPLGEGWLAEVSCGRLWLGCAPRVDWTPASLVGERGRLVFGAWRLEWRREPAPERVPRDGWTTWVAGQDPVVRPWRAGDRIFPIEGVGHRSVAHCLQDGRVRRSARIGWPILVDASNRPLWVVGVCRGQGDVPTFGSEAVRIDASIS